MITVSKKCFYSPECLPFSVKSSGQVGETNEEFKSMSGHIQNSRKILTRYSRREFTDKLLIFLALVFFFATVLYIVKKRFFGVSGGLSASGGGMDAATAGVGEMKT